jgi:hypothetical protein
VALDSETITAALTGLASAIGGIAAGILWVRKKISSDEVELDEHRAKRSVMSDLQHERDLWHTDSQRLREQLEVERQARAGAEMRARVWQGDFEHLVQSHKRLLRRSQRMAERLVQAGLMDQAEAGDLFTRFGELDQIPSAPSSEQKP